MPFAIGLQINCYVTAIAVPDDGQLLAGFGSMQGRLGNAREVLPNRVTVFIDRLTKLMEVHLLIKMQICLPTFACSRVARVVKALAVVAPGNRAARSGVLHAWDQHVHILTGGNIDHMHATVFTAFFGQGNCHQPTIGGGFVEIDGDGPIGGEHIWIQHDLFVGWLVGGRERHQQSLLLGRLRLDGE